MCSAEQTDLYAVLGAHPSESVQQLRRRYQQLALQFHPDRVGGQRSSTAESALSRFLEVDGAWKILSDQNTRREYDSQRRGGLPLRLSVGLTRIFFSNSSCFCSHIAATL
uniref:J domain-containing protein n=1 Tax=Oryzias sinensis TaxID=183150 RepID=A0A8C7X3H4_9TELE